VTLQLVRLFPLSWRHENISYNLLKLSVTMRIGTCCAQNNLLWLNLCLPVRGLATVTRQWHVSSVLLKSFFAVRCEEPICLIVTAFLDILVTCGLHALLVTVIICPGPLVHSMGKMSWRNVNGEEGLISSDSEPVNR
jgi:hypothetical protein